MICMILKVHFKTIFVRLQLFQDTDRLTNTNQTEEVNMTLQKYKYLFEDHFSLQIREMC